MTKRAYYSPNKTIFDHDTDERLRRAVGEFLERRMPSNQVYSLDLFVKEYCQEQEPLKYNEFRHFVHKAGFRVWRSQDDRRGRWLVQRQLRSVDTDLLVIAEQSGYPIYGLPITRNTQASDELIRQYILVETSKTYAVDVDDLVQQIWNERQRRAQANVVRRLAVEMGVRASRMRQGARVRWVLSARVKLPAHLIPKLSAVA